MILASRHSIKQDLLAYGEIDLAMRIDTASDEDLNRIGKLAMGHLGNGTYLSKQITLAAIEFFEGSVREPKRSRRNMSAYAVEEPEPKENVVARTLKSANRSNTPPKQEMTHEPNSPERLIWWRRWLGW